MFLPPSSVLFTLFIWHLPSRTLLFLLVNTEIGFYYCKILTSGPKAGAPHTFRSFPLHPIKALVFWQNLLEGTKAAFYSREKTRRDSV